MDAVAEGRSGRLVASGDYPDFAVAVSQTLAQRDALREACIDFAQGFALWRELHKSANGMGISLAALTAIHLVHRWFAVLVVLVLAALAWRLRTQARRSSAWLASLLVLQFATGLANVVLGWPLAAALLHTVGAAALLLVLLQVLVQAGSANTPAPTA